MVEGDRGMVEMAPSPVDAVAHGWDHVVVLGAGAAGLSAALTLARQGAPVTVLEKDPATVGGMSRTLDFLGCRFDIGPQRFRSPNAEIEAWWSELLGDEWRLVDRLSRVFYRGRYFDYPLNAANPFRGLGAVEAARCLASYARSRIRPVDNPGSFEEVMSNQVGQRLFSTFFKTYPEKVWGVAASELAADGGDQAIQGFNLLELARTALLRGATAGEPVGARAGTAFRYPRLGAGQLWMAVATELTSRGHAVRLGEEVVALRHAGGRVLAASVRDATGRPVEVLGTHFISALPIRQLIARLAPAVPSMVRAAADALSYRDVIAVNVVVDRADVFPDQWIYVHDPAVKVARISNFKNLSSAMVSDADLTGLGMEYFCSQGDGLSTMADAELLDLARRELVALGICHADEVKAGFVHRQRNRYPRLDDGHPGGMAVISAWLARALPNLWLMGVDDAARNNIQEHAVQCGMAVARRVAGRSSGAGDGRQAVLAMAG